MKKIATIAIYALIFANVSAQTKTKTSTQPAKPSKQTTITYLNKKLNEDFVGLGEHKVRTLYEYDAEASKWKEMRVINFSNYYQSYSVEVKNAEAFIMIQTVNTSETVFNKNGGLERNNNDITIQIPVSKISDIKFIHFPHTKNGNPPALVDETGSYRTMLIITNGNVITSNDNSTGNKIKVSNILIPSFNMEDEIKIEKAIRNLQTFYKQENDPFNN